MPNLTAVLQGEDRTTVEDIVIVDSGSNANGDYMKFSDGTIICWDIVSAAATADTVWTFPLSFTVTPVISQSSFSASGTASTNARFGTHWDTTITSVGLSKWLHDGTTLAGSLYVLAIGR